MNNVVSVVIPVYNVEKYLNKCIESVLNQTFQDIEVVLVDDGSMDRSGSICDKYSSKYSNFKVFHKSNNGPSDARNVGVMHACGEYIFFLDSDDYIIPECLDILYHNLVKYDAEISCGSFGFFDEKHPVLMADVSHHKLTICDGRDACLNMLYGKGFFSSSCNMLIKSEIVRNNPFPVGKFHEDEMTTFRYFLEALKVIMTNQNTYFYYQREGSIMHSVGKQIVDEVLSGDFYVEVCREEDSELLKAALCKKYYLYCTTVEKYPWLKENEITFYNKAMEYIKSNSMSIILDFKAPLSIKVKAIKYLLMP